MGMPFVLLKIKAFSLDIAFLVTSPFSRFCATIHKALHEFVVLLLLVHFL